MNEVIDTPINRALAKLPGTDLYRPEVEAEKMVLEA